MSDEQLQEWIKAIAQKEPALSDAKPQGWIDFRDRELTKLCRFGIFFRIDSISPRCKVIVGSETLAIEAKEALRRRGLAGTIEAKEELWFVPFDPPSI